MQALIDLARKGFFPDGSNVLFASWGAPAIGYSYTHRDG